MGKGQVASGPASQCPCVRPTQCLRHGTRPSLVMLAVGSPANPISPGMPAPASALMLSVKKQMWFWNICCRLLRRRACSHTVDQIWPPVKLNLWKAMRTMHSTNVGKRICALPS